MRRDSVHRLRRSPSEHVRDPFVLHPLARGAHCVEHRIDQEGVRELVGVVVELARRLDHRGGESRVDRVQHRVQAHAGGLGEQRQREGAPDRRGGDEDLHCVGRDTGESAAHEIGHPGRQRQGVGDRPRPRRAHVGEDSLLGHRAQELHHEEGIALRVAQDVVEQIVAELRAVQRALEPLAHLRGREPLEPQLAHPLVA